MEAGLNLLSGHKGVHFVAVSFYIEDAAVASDDCDDEQGAGEVTEECDQPVQQHLWNGQPSVQDSDGGKLVVDVSLLRC